MNGCSYVLSANTGALSIQGCAAITTTVLGNCAVSIPPQILGTVSYVNQGSGEGREILAKASLKGIEFTVTGCIPKWTFNNGTYTGEWLLKGTINGTSVPTGVWVG